MNFLRVFSKAIAKNSGPYLTNVIDQVSAGDLSNVIDQVSVGDLSNVIDQVVPILSNVRDEVGAGDLSNVIDQVVPILSNVRDKVSTATKFDLTREMVFISVGLLSQTLLKEGLVTNDYLKYVWTTIWVAIGICENCGHPTILGFYGISIGSDCPCCGNGVCIQEASTYLFDIPHQLRTCKNKPETCERTYTHSIDIIGLKTLVEQGFDRTDAICAMIDGKNNWKEAEAILNGKTVSAELFLPIFFLRSDILNIYLSKKLSKPPPHSQPTLKNIPSPHSQPNMNPSFQSLTEGKPLSLTTTDTVTSSTGNPVDSWTSADVQKWICSLGSNWEQVAVFFAFTDGPTLMELSYDDLISMNLSEIQAVPLSIKIRNLKNPPTVPSNSWTSADVQKWIGSLGSNWEQVAGLFAFTDGSTLMELSSGDLLCMKLSQIQVVPLSIKIRNLKKEQTNVSSNSPTSCSQNSSDPTCNGFPLVSTLSDPSYISLPQSSENGLMSGNGLSFVSSDSSYVPISQSNLNSNVVIEHEKLKKYYIEPSILDISAHPNSIIGSGAYSKVLISSLKSKNFPIYYSAAYKIINLNFTALCKPRLSLVSREIENMGKLIHPNILKFYGYSMKDKDNLIIITEYMEKGSLNDNLMELDNELVLMLAKQIVEGMLFMYQNGIFHRDLTGTNILLTGHKRRLIAKVADFGLSRAIGLDDHTTSIGQTRYMAPEVLQSNGNKFTEKSDVYSFGMVLWSMFTKEKPFGEFDNDQQQIINAINRGMRPRIPEVCFLASLIEACFNADPDKRPTFEMIKNYLIGIS